MFILHDQNARQDHNIKTANTSFENMVKFKYLEMTLRNQDFIHEEIKRRLTS
jgi:hypothetical protein